MWQGESSGFRSLLELRSGVGEIAVAGAFGTVEDARASPRGLAESQKPLNHRDHKRPREEGTEKGIHWLNRANGTSITNDEVLGLLCGLLSWSLVVSVVKAFDFPIRVTR